MSDVANWIGKNISLGGLLSHAASATGTVSSVAVKGLGIAAAQLADEDSKKQEIISKFYNAADVIDNGVTSAGSIAGAALNKGIVIAGEYTGKAAAGVARVSGASEETVIRTEQIATVVGAAVVGTVAGMGIASAAVAASAAAGTSGAAATASGLAALGGGSVAAGGGGMAAGQAVTQAIVAASGASATASLKAKECEKKP